MLPLASIAVLRIYDNELIRQTESALLAQGAVLQSTYTNLLLGRFEVTCKFPPDGYGLAREVEWPGEWNDEVGRFPPTLDVTVDEIFPAAPDPVEPKVQSDECARGAAKDTRLIIDETESMTQASIRVVDWRGTMVSATDERVGMSIGHREEVRRALRGEVVSLLRARETDEEVSWIESITRRTNADVVVAVPVVNKERVYGAVVLSRAPVSLVTALLQNGPVFAGLLAVLIIGVSMITLLTTVTIQRPIRQLIRQARRIGASSGRIHTIPNPGTQEFDQLSAAIANMARSLEDRNEYIRSFARNVSHEFKTPLASIKGTVELLEDHFQTMSDEKRAQFLSMIAADTERLDRLVRRLLELARADVFNPTTEWVDAAGLLPEIAARSDANLELDLETDRLAVAMASDAFESVFTNLFDNAAQHGGENVRVELVDRSGGMASLLVSDDGPGISEANREKIFESFFTTAREEGGTGLGLSIVKSMLQRHGGDIQLTPSEGGGAAFLVRMPLTRES
jgi:signal transduction histidine kinase